MTDLYSPTRFDTVDIYDISPPQPSRLSPEAYKDITKSPRTLMNSILLKSNFFSEAYEDLDHYMYICNVCDKQVYYFDRENHKKLHRDNCCVIL